MVVPYEESLKIWERAEERRRRAKIITKASEVQLQKSEGRGHRYTVLASPEVGFELKTIEMFMFEIEPGGCSRNEHRHVNEVIIHVLKGKGYTTIDGQKLEWEEGDTMSVPTNAWHQHFNTDSHQPARLLAAANGPLMENLGLFRMEDKGVSPQGS